ncbi:aquaporin-8-like [Glandiceps talaboti]
MATDSHGTIPGQTEMTEIQERIGRIDSESQRRLSERDSRLISTDSGDRRSKWSDLRKPYILTERWIRPVFAEFFGTMMFVFIGSLSGVVGYGATVDQASGLLVTAAAHGFTITLLIAGIGQASGGHFNPVVTLGVLCCGQMNVILGGLYMIFQLVGAICGAAIVMGVLTTDQYNFINGGATLLGEGISTDKAIGCEWILTMVLVSTVLQAAVDSKPSVLAPLAIGLAVLVDILAGGTISGASMNPARSFGPAVIYGTWTDHWVYWVGPPGGAISSAIIYKLILASQDKRWACKQE